MGRGVLSWRKVTARIELEQLGEGSSIIQLFMPDPNRPAMRLSVIHAGPAGAKEDHSQCREKEESLQFQRPSAVRAQSHEVIAVGKD